MLRGVQLSNFKKFEQFSLRLRQGNILVGPNNAGKSSILDAFRLLEACLRYARRKNPSYIQIEGAGVYSGYEVPDSVLPISVANAAHNYDSDDAILTFEHENKSVAVIRVHPERATRFYLQSFGPQLTTAKKFNKAFPLELIIVPTLAPLEAEEQWVKDETVQRNVGTRLASRHLRNFWLRQTDADFEAFKEDVEKAWPTITLMKPELRASESPAVQMFYSENRIMREITWAGFGFQVWLQLQTHLRRGCTDSLVVIDEPDIYLHPDLQRRFLRSTRSRFGQFVMATHSVEITNEAEADEIVSINPRFRSGKRINSDEEYANLYRYLGSSDNADFARIAKSRKIIFVEGHDSKLLRRLARRFNLPGLADPATSPIVQLGGFSQWMRAITAVWAFQQILDIHIEAFCLFDRDYRCAEEVREFVNRITGEPRVTTVVHERKEIENYLLVPEAIYRAAERRLAARPASAQRLTKFGFEFVVQQLLTTTDAIKNRVRSRHLSGLLEYYSEKGTSISTNTLIENFENEFDREWATLDFRLARAPGKEVLASLNETIQAQLGLSLTEAMIVDQLSPAIIDQNFLGTLRRMEAFCAD